MVPKKWIIAFLTLLVVLIVALRPTEKKQFLIRVDIEPLFCLNKTCYWPEQGGNYPYNLMEECLIDEENPDWSCAGYSEKGFLEGLTNILKTTNEENVKISLCFMGDVVKWLDDHRDYTISDEYTVNDLITDIKKAWDEDKVEVGLHATRSEDLAYEMKKQCNDYTCSEQYFDFLIKTGIQDFEKTFGRKPDYWHKHLGIGAIEDIRSNYSCIYLNVLQKNNIPIFGAHFAFTEESIGGANSRVTAFEDYSVKETSLGRISEPIPSNLPHFTTTWDDQTYIVTTHSWNFGKLEGYEPCQDCKFAGKPIFNDYTQELRKFIQNAKKTGNFITYKELSKEKTSKSELICQK